MTFNRTHPILSIVDEEKQMNTSVSNHVTTNPFVENLVIMPDPSMYRLELLNYADWMTAVIREFIQNSIDAGSTKIDIIWNASKNVLTIKDNGKGMTEDVLRNVYFALGRSTKRGDNTQSGGFGKARIATCIAQKYFIIKTLDNYVYGQGPNIQYSKLPSDQYVQGCHIEVGLITEIKGKTQYLYMDDTAEEYLKYCDFGNVTITINGKVFNNYLKVKPSQYVSDLELNGNAFCKVYKYTDNYAKHKMVVRSNGLMMFEQYVSNLPCWVVLDIVLPSSDVLISNRDQFIAEYGEVVKGFTTALVTDHRSMLEKKRKLTIVPKFNKGITASNKKKFAEKEEKQTVERLVRNLRAIDAYELIRSAKFSHNNTDLINMSRQIKAETLSKMLKAGDINQDDLKELQGYFKALKESPRGSLSSSITIPDLDDMGLSDLKYGSLNNNDDDEDIYRFYPFIQSMIVNVDTDDQKRKEIIHKQWTPLKLLNNLSSDRAKVMMMWFEVCGVVIEEYLDYLAENDIESDLCWGIGVTLDDYNNMAKHTEINGVHYLLINPLDKQGNMRYAVAYNTEKGKSSLADMVMCAIHEVCHIRHPYHDESFVNLSDDLWRSFFVMMMTKSPEIISRVKECTKQYPTLEEAMIKLDKG